jgi:hypothetical protein
VGLLFQDFVQADCSINRRFGGSGLGLSICKRIIEQMGGEIDIDSRLGHGTTVRFTTPQLVTEASNVCDKHDSAHSVLEAHIAAIGRPLRILIADDNPTNRLVAARMLQSLNAQTNMAGDGTEAVTAAVRFPYDVILMDMRMPEMDGLDATRTLRERGIAVPVIAFTANAFADDIKACAEAGMNGFVAKPVRKKVLLEAIARVLDARGEPLTAATAAVEEAASASQPRAPAPSATGEVLDRAAYDALAVELGEDGMQEAVAAFIAEMAARLEALRQYPLEQSRSAVSREAHTIKGTAGTFGFRRLAELAKWLERNVDKVTAEEFADVTERVEAAFREAQALLPGYPSGEPPQQPPCPPNGASSTALQCMQKEAS